MRRFGRFLLPLFLCLLLTARADVSVADDTRIANLKDQIAALQVVIDAAHDPGEKSRLEEKQAGLGEELKVIQARKTIEARQHSLSGPQNLETFDLLEERLGSIYFSADEAEGRVRELAAKRQRALEERDAAVAEAEAARTQSPEREAEMQDSLVAKNEELRALSLERDAAEAEMELARDCDRIRGELKADTETLARPTIRSLLHTYAQVRSGRKFGDPFGSFVSNLGQNLRVSEESLDLARKELGKFDEERVLLEGQTGFFRRDPKVERLLAEQRNQKQSLTERIPFLVRQVAADRRIGQALRTRQELGRLEDTFQEEQFDTLESAYLRRLRWPAAALIGLFCVYLGMSRMVLPLYRKDEALFLSRRVGRYTLAAACLAVVVGFLFDDLTMLSTTLGFISAALVISLQDVSTSICGWLVIVSGGKFRIGDRLEVDGCRGDVLDIKLLRTTLLEVNAWLGIDQPTGRVIFLPNNFIFKTKVFNFTHGHPFIWGKVDITITFSTPVASAIALFQKVLTEETREQFEDARKGGTDMRRRYGIADADYQPKIYTHIADSGVTLSLFFVAHYRQFSATRNRLNTRLISEIETHPHIVLAYQTLQLYQDLQGPGSPSAILGPELTSPPFAKPAAKS